MIAATSRLPTTTTTFGARAFFTDLCYAVQRLVKALLGNYLRNENVFTSFQLEMVVLYHYISHSQVPIILEFELLSSSTLHHYCILL